MAPSAPTGLGAVRSAGGARLDWIASAGATAYTVWRSPVAGGGYVLAGTASGTTYTDRAAPAAAAHYVIRAIDASGNVGPASADIALPVAPPPLPSAAPAAPGAPVLPVALGLIVLGLLGIGASGAILRRRRPSENP
jgi:hypothetical protein